MKATSAQIVCQHQGDCPVPKCSPEVSSETAQDGRDGAADCGQRSDYIESTLKQARRPGAASHHLTLGRNALRVYLRTLAQGSWLRSGPQALPRRRNLLRIVRGKCRPVVGTLQERQKIVERGALRFIDERHVTCLAPERIAARPAQ